MLFTIRVALYLLFIISSFVLDPDISYIPYQIQPALGGGTRRLFLSASLQSSLARANPDQLSPRPFLPTSSQADKPCDWPRMKLEVSHGTGNTTALTCRPQDKPLVGASQKTEQATDSENPLDAPLDTALGSVSEPLYTKPSLGPEHLTVTHYWNAVIVTTVGIICFGLGLLLGTQLARPVFIIHCAFAAPFPTAVPQDIQSQNGLSLPVAPRVTPLPKPVVISPSAPSEVDSPSSSVEAAAGAPTTPKHEDLFDFTTRLLATRLERMISLGTSSGDSSFLTPHAAVSDEEDVFGPSSLRLYASNFDLPSPRVAAGRRLAHQPTTPSRHPKDVILYELDRILVQHGQPISEPIDAASSSLVEEDDYKVTVLEAARRFEEKLEERQEGKGKGKGKAAVALHPTTLGFVRAIVDKWNPSPPGLIPSESWKALRPEEELVSGVVVPPGEMRSLESFLNEHV